MSEKDTLKQELAEIDGRIEELKEKIELGKALEELHEDERFKKVVLEGYFDEEAKRLFGLLTTPTSLKRDQLENVMDKLSAIRNFKGYFKEILLQAGMAPSQIEEEEAYRQQVTADASITKSIGGGE